MQLFRNVFGLFIIVVFGYTVDLSCQIKKIEFTDVWSYSLNVKLFDDNKNEDLTKLKSSTVIAYKLDDYFGKTRRTKSSEVTEKYKNGNCVKITSGVVVNDYIFDKEGNKVEEKVSIGDKLFSKKIFTYNDKKRMIDITDFTSEHDMFGKIKYKYDESDNLISEVVYGANGKVESKKEYEYNSDGDETIKYIYNSNGNQINKTIHKYVEDSKRSEFIVLDGFNNLEYKTKYYYDTEHRLISIILMDFEVSAKTTFLFNIDNDYVSEIIMDSDLELIKNNLSDKLDDVLGDCSMFYAKTIFTYKNDKLVEMIDYNSDSTVDKKVTNIYNDIGNVIEHNSIVNNSKTKTILDYDENNYWVEKTTYLNDIPIKSIERKIEYNK